MKMPIPNTHHNRPKQGVTYGVFNEKGEIIESFATRKQAEQKVFQLKHIEQIGNKYKIKIIEH